MGRLVAAPRQGERDMNRLTAYTLLILLVMSAACGGQRVQPQPLTPAQQLALAKAGLAIASSTLDVLAAKATDATKARILRAAKGIVDEFIVQTSDVAVIDLSTSPKVKDAIARGLTAAQHLT